ncbi:MAG TPA: protoporphyrinogen oxidase HemJ [Nevskiales bacterium]|nr:protoporphyrinogen oxidase HemJ [Nevskiales bacterium]
MHWIKAFHLIFMVTWFAGLFYLPRLFVYHAGAADDIGRERFTVMERKLFAIMSIGAAGTIVFGLWLLARTPGLLDSGWLQLKLVLVLGLLAYHVWLGGLCRAFRHGRNRRGQRFYRWINEIPALFLVAIVILAVVRPF